MSGVNNVHGEEAAEGDKLCGGKTLTLLIQVDWTLIQKQATKNSMDNAQYRSPSWDFGIPHDVPVTDSSLNNEIQHVLLDMIKEMHTIPKDPVDSVLT